MKYIDLSYSHSTKELINRYITNFKKLPKNIRERIINASMWNVIGSQELLIYDNKKSCIIDCGIELNEDKIKITSLGCRDGLQWKES